MTKIYNVTMDNWNQGCGDWVTRSGQSKSSQCDRPSKATRYYTDHTYPSRVCGTHARAAEKRGLPVVWDPK
jgi:hypothetical protein